jgi:non-ribosomal peptide synthetase component F
VEAEESLRLDNNICKHILRISLDLDVTPFTLILTALAIILHKYTREEELVVGSSGANFNPLVLRIPVSDSDSFKELVEKVKKIEENAIEHDVPYQKLYEKLCPPTDEASGPLFQVRVFNVSDVQTETLEAASCDWTIFVEQLSDAKSLLPLKVRVVYNTILFARDRIQELLRQVQQLLSMVAKNQDEKVSEMSLLTTYGKNVVPNPEEELDSSFFGSIQSYLTKHAHEHPDRVAIANNEREYPYKYVEETSNRIANYLIRDGIHKGGNLL